VGRRAAAADRCSNLDEPYDFDENSLGPERTRLQLRLCTCTDTPTLNNFREANVSHKFEFNHIPGALELSGRVRTGAESGALNLPETLQV
jgi:hypothetical protein